jgi:regulator of protease activity HflC (stomatin/prohibitin superfamily)
MGGGDDTGAGDSGEKPEAPIGGVVRDPREQVKEPPSVTRYWRRRSAEGIRSFLVALGLKRPRNPDGTLGPRSWKRLSAFIGTIVLVILIWTSVHIVPPGNVAVPVTLGHSSKQISSGFHITLPFTTTYSMSTRVQNYTMSSVKSDSNTDDSVQVLGADGGAASVNATVLYRLDPKHATDVYRQIGTGYTKAVVRPSARTCIRDQFTHYNLVDAATTAWGKVQTDVTDCIKAKLEPRGFIVQDFQMREVTLSPDVQTSVNKKVAAQQLEEQQKFDKATAEQQADIARIQALGAAEASAIAQCGGKVVAGKVGGEATLTVVPNCANPGLSNAYLEFTYIQALKQLTSSPGTNTVVLPFDKNLTPVINVGGSGSTATTSGG